jgi:hypothetical protein
VRERPTCPSDDDDEARARWNACKDGHE